jgi:hypothetical protein
MLELLRVLAEAGAAASWAAVFIAAIITVFVGYIGIAMYATLRACDDNQRATRSFTTCCRYLPADGAGDHGHRPAPAPASRQAALLLTRAGSTHHRAAPVWAQLREDLHRLE